MRSLINRTQYCMQFSNTKQTHHLSSAFLTMRTPSISTLAFFLLLISSCSWAVSADGHDDFLQCLSQQINNYSSISNDVYTRANSSYTSILQSGIRNTRFASESTPKPQVIITPEHESQIPAVISCASQSGLEIRTRSGGHDMEGLSYVSQKPFVIIDLVNLSQVTVDVEEKTAWMGAGATMGSLYYRIAEKSPVLAFPGSICTTVGVGGHFSGGGYGPIMRKHGLAGDNVIDARIIDVKGRILDRKSMGEDLFWAIRGGGGASFGVIVAWKVQLVDVPERVTVFSVMRPLGQNSTQLVERWQHVAPQADKDLFIAVFLLRVNSTLQTNLFSLFLGGADRLVAMMQESFPELGLRREECTEMSWIQATLFLNGQQGPLEVLLNRTAPSLGQLKTRLDYVQTPMAEDGFDGLVRMLAEPEAQRTQIGTKTSGERICYTSKKEVKRSQSAGSVSILKPGIAKKKANHAA